MVSIIDLPERIGRLPAQNKALFNRFFQVSRYTGRCVVPPTMKLWVDKSFDGVSKVASQRIVRVDNLLMFEGALYNELRSKRPMSLHSTADIDKTVNEDHNTAFRNPLKMTPSDTFGRLKGPHSITAANIAKYDKWHGLVVFNKHHPLNFTQSELTAHLDLAMRWIKKVHNTDKKADYPFIMWNCLWRAAASLIHGHMQLIVTQPRHFSGIELYNNLRETYKVMFNGDMFNDLFESHRMVGLGVELNDCRVYCSLTPAKDKGTWLLFDKWDSKRIGKRLYQALTGLKSMGMVSFNVGMYLPPIKKVDGWKGFPIMISIVDRGKISTPTADIGAMELIAGQDVIETDPYKVMSAIKKYLK
ncbi:hypothetical protein JW868_01195 [Candidatus Woesearchaeota archaeon]|nr:hypothetical protein [Candidatus Woesearchaeota archaeon]